MIKSRVSINPSSFWSQMATCWQPSAANEIATWRPIPRVTVLLASSKKKPSGIDGAVSQTRCLTRSSAVTSATPGKSVMLGFRVCGGDGDGLMTRFVASECSSDILSKGALSS
jgi:hypothetical protein